MVSKTSIRLRDIKNKLGMPLSTAQNQLLKNILFYYIKKNNPNCYQCGSQMTEDDWSIEHKHSWMYSDNPKKNFFDPKNVGFSHFSCNRENSRKAATKGCPSISSYNNGCRCDGCVSLFDRNKEKWKSGVKINPTKGRTTKVGSVKSDDRRVGKEQLGINVSTAYNHLIRNLLLDFYNKDGNSCHLCGGKVTRDNYKVSHKTDWKNSSFPKKSFFSLSNVCIVHKNCNRNKSVVD